MWFSLFFLTEMHITKTQNRARFFILLKYFLNNLLLTLVQNVISKFVKVLSQELTNSFLEKLWARLCAAACYNYNKV